MAALIVDCQNYFNYLSDWDISATFQTYDNSIDIER